MLQKKRKSLYIDRLNRVLVTWLSIGFMLSMMGQNVIAAEKNTVTYEYANDEKTQVKAVSYTSSDYAELYEDHLTLGDTFTSGGTEYPIVGIGASAFANTKLCSIIIKERDTPFFIDQKAFQNVSVLNPLAKEGAGSITVSCDVDTIGDYAFSNAVVSNNICFEGDVGTIEAYAFQNITAGGYMDFQGEIDIVGEYAMSNMQIAGFKRIQIREIRKGAFSDNAMTTWHHLDGLEIVGDNAFEDCTELVDMTFPDTVISIGSNCFKGCTSLESITLPANSALTIGENAFPNQDGLVIVVPSEVTDISTYNFNALTNVVFQIDVDCATAVIQYFEDNGMQYKEGANGEVIKGGDTGTSDDDSGNSSGGTGNESESGNTGNTENGGTAPDAGDNSTENGAGGNSNNINTVPETPQKGKTYTYKNMIYKVTGSNTVTFMKPVDKKVKKVSIPSKVTILGKSFKVTKINKKACYNCNKLTTVTIGNNVTTIGDQAFAKCTKLKQVTIGKGVTTIGKQAFANDKSLRKFRIRTQKLKTIKKGTFKGVNKDNVSFTAPTKKTKIKYGRLLSKKSVWK